MRRLRRAAASPGALLALIALITYGYFYQAGGWNQNTRFAMVRASVEDGTARIDDYAAATGDKAEREGHYYSDKAPGASWLGIPAYAAARTLAGEDAGVARADDFAYVVTAFAVAVPSALAVAALYALLGAFGIPAGARIGAAAGYAFGTLAFPFSTLYYGHQLAAAFVVFGIYFLIAPGDRGRALSPAVCVGAGLCFGVAVAVEYPAALAVAAALVYAAARARSIVPLAWIAVGLAGPGLAVAVYHAVVFGGPFTLPYEYSTQPHRHAGFFMGLGVPRPEALWGILASPYRGLFYAAPWLVLAGPGIWLLARRGLRAEAALCAAVFLLFVWMNASLVDWEGGWTVGPRYLIPAIPFLAIGAAGLGLSRAGGARRRAAAIGAGALVAVSSALMLVAAAVKPEVPVDIERPFSEFLLPRLAEGELADNPQSIESRGSPEGGDRYAWNWGQKMGLSGAASLAPLLAVWAAGAAGLAALGARRERARGFRRARPE